jgi:hypothetical protein
MRSPSALVAAWCCACALLRPVDGFVPALAPRPASAALRTAAPLMGRKGRPKMPSGGLGPQQGSQRSPDPVRRRPPPNATKRSAGFSRCFLEFVSQPADGSSVFYLYTRTGPGKPWYPVSAMKG